MTASNTSTTTAIAQYGISYYTNCNSWTTNAQATLYGGTYGGATPGASGKWIQWNFNNAAASPGTLINDNSNFGINISGSTAVFIDVNRLIGVGTNVPVGKFSANLPNVGLYGALGTGSGNWNSNFAIFGPGAASNTSGGVGIAWSTTCNTGYINSISPSVNWLPLVVSGSYISFIGCNTPGTWPTVIIGAAEGQAPYRMLEVVSNMRISAKNGSYDPYIELTRNQTRGCNFGTSAASDWAISCCNANLNFRQSNTWANSIGGTDSAPAMSISYTAGLKILNGYRPTFSNITATTLSPTQFATYGTHYYLTNSAFSAVTVPPPIITLDSSGYWVFRNATGTYMSVTFTWPTTYYSDYNTALSNASPAPSPASNILTIPPSNSITVMFTSNAGNFCFAGFGGSASNQYSVF